jgi:putative aldouronate transport system substrate-binding protein
MKKMLFRRVLGVLVLIPALGFCGGRKEQAPSAAQDGRTVITWFNNQPNQPGLTYWSDAMWIKELERRFNLSIQFIGPVGGDYSESLNVMLASGELPDIISYGNWNNYNGGLLAAIDDGIVFKYGDKPEYRALLPNWLRLIEGNDSVRRSVTMDDGNLAIFCHVEESTNRAGYEGLGIRKDWLDRLGLAVPTTVEELHTVLTAFKTQDANGNGNPNDEIPYTDSRYKDIFHCLLTAWGLNFNDSFYPNPQNPAQLTHRVLYKNGQPFMNAIGTLAAWHREGLFEPDWLTQENSSRVAKIVNDQVGMFAAAPHQYAEWREALKQLKPEIASKVKIVAVPRLIGPEGKPYTPYGNFANWANPTEAIVITPVAEKAGKVPTILRLFDFMYSPEGTELISFGFEGVTFYKDENGNHRWTEAMTNDPEYPLYTKLLQYCLPSWGGWPKVMSYEAWKLNDTADPDAAAGHAVYIQGDRTICMPRITYTPQETEDANSLMADINTALDEFTMAVIMGDRPTSDVPAFINQLKSMGIERVLAIRQGAYDRYLKK